jgi:hypothetical protein
MTSSTPATTSTTNAQFISAVNPHPGSFSGVDLTNEEAVKAIGNASITVGDCTLYIGYRQVSSLNQNPCLLCFKAGKQLWCRQDYENTNDDSKGTGLVWDIQNQRLYATFTCTGSQGTPDQDFRRFAKKGWLPSYGQGGGPAIIVLVRIDLTTGDPQVATYISAVLSSGKSNACSLKGLSINVGNVVVNAETRFSPRGIDRKALIYNETKKAPAPFNYTLELTPDLSKAVRATAPEFEGLR